MNSDERIGKDGSGVDNVTITELLISDDNLKKNTIGTLSADGYLLCVHKSTFSSEIAKLILISGGSSAQGDVGIISCENGISLPDSFPVQPYICYPEVLDGNEVIPKLVPSFYMPYSPVIFGASGIITDPLMVNKSKVSTGNEKVDTSLGYLNDDDVVSDINQCITNIGIGESHLAELKQINTVTEKEVCEMFKLFDNIPEDERSDYMLYVIGTPAAYVNIALGEATTTVDEPLTINVGSFIRTIEDKHTTIFTKEDVVHTGFAMPIYSPGSIQNVCSNTQKTIIVDCLGGSKSETIGNILKSNYCKSTKQFPKSAFLESVCATQLCQVFPYGVKISLPHFLKIIRFISQFKRAPTSTEKELKGQWCAQNNIQPESHIELLTLNVLFDLYRSFESVNSNNMTSNTPQQSTYIRDFISTCLIKLKSGDNTLTVEWVALNEYDSRQNGAVRSLMDKFACIRNRSYKIKDNRQQKTGIATSHPDVMKHCYIEPCTQDYHKNVKDQIILALSMDKFAYRSVLAQMHREVRLAYIESIKDLNAAVASFRLSCLEEYRPLCTCDVTPDCFCACKIIDEWCKLANYPKGSGTVYKTKTSVNSKNQNNFKNNTLLSTYKIQMKDSMLSIFGDAQKEPDNSAKVVTESNTKDQQSIGSDNGESKKNNLWDNGTNKRLSIMLAQIARECTTGMESYSVSYGDRIPMQKGAHVNEMCSVDYASLCDALFNIKYEKTNDDGQSTAKRRNVQKTVNYKQMVDEIIHSHVEKWIKYWHSVAKIVRSGFCIDGDNCSNTPAQSGRWNYKMKATLNLDHYNGLYKTLFVTSVRYLIASMSLIEVMIGSLKNEHIDVKFPLPDNQDLFTKIMSSNMGIKTEIVHLKPIKEMHFFGKGTTEISDKCTINLRECNIEHVHTCPIMTVKGASKMDEKLQYVKKGTSTSSPDRNNYLLCESYRGFKFEKLLDTELFYEKYTDCEIRQEHRSLCNLVGDYDASCSNLRKLFLSHTYKAVMCGIGKSVIGTSIHSASSEKIRSYIQNESAQPHLFYFIKSLEMLYEIYAPQGFRISEGDGYLSDLKHLLSYIVTLRVLRYTVENQKPSCISSMITSTNELSPFNVIMTHRLDLWNRRDTPYVSFPSSVQFYPAKGEKTKYFGGVNMARVSCDKSYIVDSIKEDIHRIKKFTRTVDMPFVVLVSPNVRAITDDVRSDDDNDNFDISSIILQGKSGNGVQIEMIRQSLPCKIGFKNLNTMLQLCPTVEEVVPIISRSLDISVNDANELIAILYQNEYNICGKDVLNLVDFYSQDDCDSSDECMLDE